MPKKEYIDSFAFLRRIGTEAGLKSLDDGDSLKVFDHLAQLYWRYRGMGSTSYDPFQNFCRSLLERSKNGALLGEFDGKYEGWQQSRFGGATRAYMVLLDSDFNKVLVLKRDGQPFIPSELIGDELPSITARNALKFYTGRTLRGEEPVKMLAGQNGLVRQNIVVGQNVVAGQNDVVYVAATMKQAERSIKIRLRDVTI